VTPGWSEAYGLFLDGEADMVLSYTTSPAYHLIAEEDPSKAAARVRRGALHADRGGRHSGRQSDQPELAREFLSFMLTEAFQAVIPTTNWMYPGRPACRGVARRVRHADHAHRSADPEPGGGRGDPGEAAIETWQSALSQLAPLAWTGAGLTALVLLAVLGPLLAVALAADAPARLGSADLAAIRFTLLQARAVGAGERAGRDPRGARAGAAAVCRAEAVRRADGRAVHPAGDRGGAGASGDLRARGVAECGA
jgi:hypothetical protein